ncbi:hypothetical protein [Microcystis sp. M53603_WE2]|nr:hypothetical protein [Microcystis sp. M53603_WE2]MDJ0605637.1 hypothetical protein [Microcystis sp. M53602_WE12]
MLVEIRQQYKTPHPTPHTPHPTPISKFYLASCNARFASQEWQFS